MQHVVTSLQLINVRVIHSRVEMYKADCYIPLIISRAFAASSTLAKSCELFSDERTMFVIMKGKKQKAMLEKLPPEYMVVDMQEVIVPGLDASRTLVFFKKQLMRDR